MSVGIFAKHRTAPLCPGEALRRGILLKLHDFHGLGANTRFMPVSTKPEKPDFFDSYDMKRTAPEKK